MIAIDWNGLGLGALLGLGAGVAFFLGLALGMRLALRAAHPLPVLLLSSALRISLLLGLGWMVAQSGATALAGFALAFVAARVAAIAIARPIAATRVSS
ncbi:hypothetical protein [Sedimentitalea nanhaiensis]|uniref:N-ATPase, AtpR subunit n=1 Tax=Sedimentitalea nanhaiensis TaxID=999627 RepID=A0A1I7BWW8_9RHOB|nr:hypothetical protein [Sedimentitalea nanhaiensis]SFT91611.1 N-ATPase, AtpR subunit [Sedimentitalea nanhaiensis]